MRYDIARYVSDHDLDFQWQAAFQVCGEYDPPKSGAAGSGVAAPSTKAAVSSALAGASTTIQPVPHNVVDAVCWAVGLRDSERHVAERLVKHMDDVEQEITLREYFDSKMKWKKDVEAWTENSARVYHLILQRCPGDLEA